VQNNAVRAEQQTSASRRPVANAFTRIGGGRLEKVAFAWR
jgi:hypothetical protein